MLVAAPASSKKKKGKEKRGQMSKGKQAPNEPAVLSDDDLDYFLPGEGKGGRKEERKISRR